MIRSSHRNRLTASLLLLGLGLLLSGCDAYKLGAPEAAPLGFSTLYVPPVRNEAVVPMIVDPVTRAIRNRIARDPRFVLASSEAGAGATLYVDVIGYQRQRTAVRVEDSGLGTAFEIEITVVARLKSRGGETFETAPITARMVSQGGDLPQNEMINQPILADELAMKIVDAALSRW